MRLGRGRRGQRGWGPGGAHLSPGACRLVAVALLYLEQEDAFWCLVAIVEVFMPRDYYTKTLLGSQVRPTRCVPGSAGGAEQPCAPNAAPVRASGARGGGLGTEAGLPQRLARRRPAVRVPAQPPVPSARPPGGPSRVLAAGSPCARSSSPGGRGRDGVHVPQAPRGHLGGTTGRTPDPGQEGGGGGRPRLPSGSEEVAARPGAC